MSEIPNSTRLLIAELTATMPKGDTASRLRWAFKQARNHWMVTDPSEQFQGAVAAVYEKSTDEERAKIRAQIAQIKSATALLHGEQPAVVDLMDYGFNIAKIWHGSNTSKSSKDLDRGE